MMRATVAALVLGFFLLTCSGTLANARGSGYGAGSPHFAPGYRSLPSYNGFRRRPLYGGYTGVPYYWPDDFSAYPPPYAPYTPDSNSSYPGEAPSTGRCLQPTHKTVTVPAEAGGTQQVTVTYCHP
jgi:hypothetical protein